jgi:hypothetical protein
MDYLLVIFDIKALGLSLTLKVGGVDCYPCDH